MASCEKCRKAGGRCKKHAAEYMRGYRKVHRGRVEAKATASLREQIIEVFERIGNREMTGLTAAAIVRDISPTEG